MYLDIQVAADGEIVLSHDKATERCFGVLKLIKDTPYRGELDQLRTLGNYSEPLPTLRHIAGLLVNDSELANIRLLLDIKNSNGPSIALKIRELLESINSDMGYWSRRILLGIWRYDVLEAVEKELSEFPIVHIGVSVPYTRQFLTGHPQVLAVSMLYLCFTGIGGDSLLKEVRAAGKKVYTWTINDESMLKWSIASKFDGITTDQVDKYVDLVNSKLVGENARSESFIPWKLYLTRPLGYCFFQLINLIYPYVIVNVSA
jgi:phosphatidylglycerol phospholipase C